MRTILFMVVSHLILTLSPILTLLLLLMIMMPVVIGTVIVRRAAGAQILNFELWAIQALVTCFFIDTPTDPAKLFQVMDGLLREGGVWVNIGPLNWKKEARLKLNFDEIVGIFQRKGYEFVTQKKMEVDYHMPRGEKMYTESYNVALTAAVKRKRDVRELQRRLTQVILEVGPEAFDARGISSLFYAWGIMRFKSKLIKPFCINARKRLNEFDPQSIANMVFGIGLLGLKGEARILDAVGKNVPNRLDEFHPEEVTSMAGDQVVGSAGMKV
ncbi:unnamed protein product [Symbiodinium sp. CCMP2592]|nr:unnamed protein product [Symbiodinium sp. CCMP2592]